MKTTILALAAVATLGMAVPAFAQEGAPRSSQAQSQAQEFSSSHRHWHWGRHHHRHHGWCRTHWRHGHRVTICR
jgi:hypothetical protein